MTRRLSFALVAASLLAVLVLVASGCGAKKERTEPGGLTPFELMLDYFPNADHARDLRGAGRRATSSRPGST